MKLKRYIVVSFLQLHLMGCLACGWYPSHSGGVFLYRIMPLDETNYGDYSTTWESDCMLHHRTDYKAENLRLWQEQTSRDIDVNDIEHVVYKTEAAFLEQNKCLLDQSNLKDNTFIKWILKNSRMDIINLLILAKRSEEVRFKMNDPWYYHVEDNEYYRILEDIIVKCRAYSSGPLLNRYALQMVRALCSLRKYKECEVYWDNIKDKLAEDVIKQMTELRTASALSKTGRKDEAITIYAKYGDVSSIRAINSGQIENELEFVYEHAPNSPYIEEELQKWLIYFGDESTESDLNKSYLSYWYVDKFNDILKVAHRAVEEKKSKHMAMWYYTLAALYDTKGDAHKAKRVLIQGERYPKDAFLKDSYHVLRMWLDAKTSTYNLAYEHRLMKDLKWLREKIYSGLTPDIIKKISGKDELTYTQIDNEYTQNYNENDNDYGYYWGYQTSSNIYYWNDVMRRLILRIICPRMHQANKHVREIQLANMAENHLVHTNDYSNEMFLIMDRLSYKDTRNYFNRIYHPRDEFDRYLNNHGRIDKYYWYDILATKCLREQRYSKAIVYLKQIPLAFQKQMNVFEYLDKDPFSYDMETFKDTISAVDYKLHFAEKMSLLKHKMNSQRNPDKRAKAMIQYALGLRNSVHRCWFLTRYSSNDVNNGNKYVLPDIPYPEDSTIYRHDTYVKWSEKLINEAIQTFNDKELAAQELRKFLRYQRIMDSYGDTKTAADIILHCDKWRIYAKYHKKPNW